MLKIITIKDKRIRFLSKKNIKYNKIKMIFLIKKMIITIYSKKGIGISSNQVNFNYKVIIIDVNKKNKPIIIINPIILKKSNFCTISTEGCLSIPKFFSSTPRAEKVCLKYINLYNKLKKKFLIVLILDVYNMR
ncbi:peptide deformylase [Candidatus Carsonella ruddii]|uniref:Peptide deformylase n=1 Tax=Carsonella ruddii TaxID=114186 RepID=A0AAJ6FQ56_CARRU|nr:peptide deformylase [Candidatus Carsonella ruddii]WGS67241.1 peptide deformylase [Candidatus Carsonella ruddii]